MAGADQYRHFSGKRVNVKFCGRVPSSPFRYQVSCLLVPVTRLQEEEKEEVIEHGQNVKIQFSITLDINCISSNIWCTPLFQHALSCKNTKSQIHSKLKVKTDICLCIAE